MPLVCCRRISRPPRRPPHWRFTHDGRRGQSPAGPPRDQPLGDRAGGGLQPSSQGILLDSFPREKQGTAQTMFGMAALLAPVIGPTLGGYITDNYGWRWIFYLNVPVGILAFFFCRAVVSDPDYLKI